MVGHRGDLGGGGRGDEPMRRRLSALLETIHTRVREWTRDDTADTPAVGRRSSEPASDAQSADRRLTDSEQQVVGVLESHDGPVWQSALVEATGWSKSTISRSLSDLEDADVIVRTRIGRRKVVFVAGEEPDVVEAPSPPTLDQPPTPGASDGADETVTARPGDESSRADTPGEQALDD